MSNNDAKSLLREAIRDLNKEKLLQLLHVDLEPCDLSKEPDLFELVTETLISRPECGHTATQIVYILSIYGADINGYTQESGSPLLKYLQSCNDGVSLDFVQAVLRCGFDATIKHQDGESVFSYVLHSGAVPKKLQELVLSFMPGIWMAVESDDAMGVRRLINQWCNIRTTKNGKSVLQLAFDKGTENIIRVITGIGASMDLAHGVLAGDVQYVRNLISSNRKLNVNIKNLSERGATPLFYALCDNDCDMVEVLLENGARLDIGMQGENEMELPLYFAVLSNHSVDEHLLKKIVPTKPVPVDQLFYRGHNVIFYCIEHDVSADLFEEILRNCSAYVLTQKTQRNISARDCAFNLERHEIVSRIDKIVSEWIYYSVNKKNRNILALHGYKHVPALKSEAALYKTTTFGFPAVSSPDTVHSLCPYNTKNRNIFAFHRHKHAPALIVAYVVGTHLNCIDKSVQFKWVPTTYAKRRRDKHYTCCNLKTTELLVCALIGACVVILLNTELNCENGGLDDCFLDLTDYENHKILLTQAVEDGDLISVKEMLYYESVLEKGLETCMADCRCSFSGQPLLHKAVLRGYAEITRLLADTLVNVTKQRIDSIRDQYFRTCLHYAYGMENGKEIINILEDHGASEFSMDKDGRSPLAFKDRQGQKEMKKLLQYHLAQDFCKDEPDPWSVPLPMPIMGYISKCLHNHHHHEQQGTKAVSCDQYDKVDLKTSQAVISSDSDEFGQQYSQIKQNDHSERTTSKKRVRISHAQYANSLGIKVDPFFEELQNQHNNTEPTKQEVGINQTGTKVKPKNGISFNVGKEVNYLPVYRSGSDYAVSQRESLEHSDSMRTSSVDTESEGSEEYEADNSSSEDEEEVAQTLEQKYCKIL